MSAPRAAGGFGDPAAMADAWAACGRYQARRQRMRRRHSDEIMNARPAAWMAELAADLWRMAERRPDVTGTEALETAALLADGRGESAWREAGAFRVSGAALERVAAQEAARVLSMFALVCRYLAGGRETGRTVV